MTRRAYTIKRGPDRPSFEEYSHRLTADFRTLLSSDPSERAVHQFLDRNPSLVPGARTPSGSRKGLLHGALITQPQLRGFRSRVPDFMWIVSDSGTWYPTLVEIERLTKKLFTRGGLPRAEFTQARTQLAQWRAWFDKPTNVQNFMDSYGVPAGWRTSKLCRLRTILVYGRRAEFENLPPELAKLRAGLLAGNDEELMSFDRLAPDPDLHLIITASLTGEGRFRAVWVPETFGIVPCEADDLKRIDGLSEAIDHNRAIPVARKTFLKERIKYWRKRVSPTGGSSDVFLAIE